LPDNKTTKKDIRKSILKIGGIMSENYFVRSFDLIEKKKLSTPIIVFGCGSIGSYSALALAKAGFNNITLLDHDIVDYENIGPQFFCPEDIGKKKNSVLESNIHLFTGTSCKFQDHKFVYDYNKDAMEIAKLISIDTIVICAIDSMKARAHLYYMLKGMQYKGFIDARMAIEFLELYSFTSEQFNSIKNYGKTLYTDDDAVQMPCTNKAISYTSLIAGGTVAKLCKDIATDKLNTYSIKLDIATMTSDVLETK
jgi:hypothetical protein